MHDCEAMHPTQRIHIVQATLSVRQPLQCTMCNGKPAQAIMTKDSK